MKQILKISFVRKSIFGKKNHYLQPSLLDKNWNVSKWFFSLAILCFRRLFLKSIFRLLPVEQNDGSIIGKEIDENFARYKYRLFQTNSYKNNSFTSSSVLSARTIPQ